MNVLYTAEVTAVGARDGHATSSDGLLDVPLALPPQMGGKGMPRIRNSFSAPIEIEQPQSAPVALWVRSLTPLFSAPA